MASTSKPREYAASHQGSHFQETLTKLGTVAPAARGSPSARRREHKTSGAWLRVAWDRTRLEGEAREGLRVRACACAHTVVGGGALACEGKSWVWGGFQAAFSSCRG